MNTLYNSDVPNYDDDAWLLSSARQDGFTNVLPLAITYTIIIEMYTMTALGEYQLLLLSILVWDGTKFAAAC